MATAVAQRNCSSFGRHMSCRDNALSWSLGSSNDSFVDSQLLLMSCQEHSHGHASRLRRVLDLAVELLHSRETFPTKP